MKQISSFFLAIIFSGTLVSCSNLFESKETYQAVMVRKRSDRLEYKVVSVTARNHSIAQPVLDKFPEGEDALFSTPIDSDVSGIAVPVDPVEVKLTTQWQQIGGTMVKVDD
jgi:hypothetical protein